MTERQKLEERAHPLTISNRPVEGGTADVLAWACVTSAGTGSLIFIDEAYDGISQMNSKVYRNICSATFKKCPAKLTRWNTPIHQRSPSDKSNGRFSTGQVSPKRALNRDEVLCFLKISSPNLKWRNWSRCCNTFRGEPVSFRKKQTETKRPPN